MKPDMLLLTMLLPIPGAANVLAEELVLRRLEPYIDIPDFMFGEQSRIEEWKATVPSAYAEAEQRAGEELGARSSWRGRLTIRISAYRRLYAAYFGSETFARLPELGGEAMIAVRLPGGSSFKLGAVAAARYRHEPKRWDEFFQWRSAAMVDAVEAAICPAATARTEAEWMDFGAMVSAAQPFRQWQATSHLPALLRSQMIDVTCPPEGVFVRRGVQMALDAGAPLGIVDLFYANGISAFLTAPAREYAERNADAITALAESSELLARFENELSPAEHVQDEAADVQAA